MGLKALYPLQTSDSFDNHASGNWPAAPRIEDHNHSNNRVRPLDRIEDQNRHADRHGGAIEPSSLGRGRAGAELSMARMFGAISEPGRSVPGGGSLHYGNVKLGTLVSSRPVNLAGAASLPFGRFSKKRSVCRYLPRHRGYVQPNKCVQIRSVRGRKKAGPRQLAHGLREPHLLGPLLVSSMGKSAFHWHCYPSFPLWNLDGWTPSLLVLVLRLYSRGENHSYQKMSSRSHHSPFLLLTVFVYLSPMPVALLPFKAYNPNATALATWAGSRTWVVGVFLDGASLAGRRRAAPAARPDQGALLTGALPPLDNATASPWLRHPLVSHNQLIGSLNISLGSARSVAQDVSGNKLAGENSGDLSRFPSSSFAGNLALCGQPLPRRVRAYHAGSASSSSNNGGFSKLSVTVLTGGHRHWQRAISVAVFVYVRRKLRSTKVEGIREDLRANDDDKCQKSGGLVCFDGGEELPLESLLKASAEVLGKGVSERTYKAVLGDCRSKAFDRHMRLVGRLRHVVSLRGYCNSNGERLLVCNFLPNGRLQSLLQATGTLLLSLQVAWRREKPGLGGVEEHRVGRGAGPVPHVPGAPGAGARERGAVQVTNILLDERGGACVSECGVMRYATNIQQPTCRRRRWCLWRRCRRVAGIR
ncbi:hypothetical protein HU200_025416 [Digitaria exilis]|uniref:Uncharacterized protein n=1 Tax=Digitaria exilis TaxID=1010633 RepID=A0A835BZH8_9POAL|nr:hypothetical protein HU200_025416 [Digitaria exilis]